MRAFLRDLARSLAPVAPCSRHILAEDQLPRHLWNAAAKQAHARGEKQRRCVGCGYWFWAWEWKMHPRLQVPLVAQLPASEAITAIVAKSLPPSALDEVPLCFDLNRGSREAA